MAYPADLRKRARELRIQKHLSVDELAERLALPRTTIYYWVGDLPLGRELGEDVGLQPPTVPRAILADTLPLAAASTVLPPAIVAALRAAPISP